MDTITETGSLDGDSHRERGFMITCASGTLDAFERCAVKHGLATQRGFVMAFNSADAGAYDSMMVGLKQAAPLVPIAGALAGVIIAYLKGKASRKVTIGRHGPDRYMRVEAQGYSTDELAKILDDAHDIFIHESEAKKAATKPPRKRAKKSNRK
jgi:hypothetical protein